MVSSGRVRSRELDGVDDLGVVASREVGAADASSEEGVAGEDHLEGGEVKSRWSLRCGRGVWMTWAG